MDKEELIVLLDRHLTALIGNKDVTGEIVIVINLSQGGVGTVRLRYEKKLK